MGAEKTTRILHSARSNGISRVRVREPFFGQEGALRGRELGDQAQSLSALAVLHSAVLARLRAEGYELPDDVLALMTLLRRHIDTLGRSNFDLNHLQDRLEQRSGL